MTTEFITHEIWSRMTKAVRACRHRCDVAVAYFGKGAGRLLPLPRGSRLVVDASERAVASGQTCPADLAKLVERDVTLFSVPNLHAKVFVLGRAAYIGSTNVSSRSASQLVEAVIRTTEPSVVNAARKFVEDHCLHELTPEVLKRLSKLYRPPQIPGGKRKKMFEDGTSERPELPRTLIEQIDHCALWTKDEQALHDREEPVARERRKHGAKYQVDSFMDYGRDRRRPGDVVIQVNDYGKGRILVAPPGNVVHTKTSRIRRRLETVVFIERPARRRRNIRLVAAEIGRGALKRLKKDGIVKDREFLQSLLNSWT